jgi:tetratricopeptide (TPR) repeat protein
MNRFFHILKILILINFFFLNFPIFSDALVEAKKAYSQRKFQKAIKLFSDYSKKAPSDGIPYMYLGYIYESMKDYKTSINYFRKAVDLKLPQDQKKTILIKILIYYNYHNAYDYIAHYTNRYIQIDSKNVEVNKMRDKALSNRGRESHISTVKIPQKENSEKEKEEPKKSIVANIPPKEKIQKEEEPNPIVKKDEELDEKKLWQESLALFNKEEFTKADKILTKLTKAFPTNLDYLYKLGITKSRIGEFEKSIQLLDQVQSKISNQDKQFLYFIHLNKGQSYHKLSKFPESIKSFETALENNNTPIVQIALMKVKYDSGDFEGSLKISESLIKNQQSNLEINMYQAISELQLGNKIKGYRLLIDFYTGLKIKYSNIKSIPEKYHTGLMYLGVFYSGRTKYKTALKYLNSVYKTRSNYLSYKFAFAKSQYYLNNMDIAIPELKKLQTIPASHYMIARYYAGKKDLPKVKQYLSKAGSMKSIYWIKIKIDSAFSDLLKDQSFYEFVNNKGIIPEKEIPKKPIEQEQPKKNAEVSVENNNIKLNGEIDSKSTSVITIEENKKISETPEPKIEIEKKQ